jgi:simple sugar transport system substrate-binding protein
MVWGLLSQPSRGERTKGVIDALEEAGMTVDYFEIDAATNADPACGHADLHWLCLPPTRMSSWS